MQLDAAPAHPDRPPLSVVIDNMIFDELRRDGECLARCKQRSGDGQLGLFVTSRQEEEVRAEGGSYDPDVRAANIDILESVPVRPIGAAPFLLDVSRLDLDHFGGEDFYDSLRAEASSLKHLNDHQGLTGALLEKMPFVTVEKRIRGSRAAQARVAVWPWERLRGEVMAL